MLNKSTCFSTLLVALSSTFSAFCYIPTIGNDIPNTATIPPNTSVPIDLSKFYFGDFINYSVDGAPLEVTRLLNSSDSVDKDYLYRIPVNELGSWDLGLPALIMTKEKVYWTYRTSKTQLPELNEERRFELPKDVLCEDMIAVDHSQIFIECHHKIKNKKVVLSFDIRSNQSVEYSVNQRNGSYVLTYYFDENENLFLFRTCTDMQQPLMEIYAVNNNTLTNVFNITSNLLPTNYSAVSDMKMRNGYVYVLAYSPNFTDYYAKVYIFRPPFSSNMSLIEHSFSVGIIGNLADFPGALIHPFVQYQSNYSGLAVAISQTSGAVLIYSITSGFFEEHLQEFITIASLKSHAIEVLGCSETFLYVLDLSTLYLVIIKRAQNMAPSLYYLTTSPLINSIYASVDPMMDYFFLTLNVMSVSQVVKPVFDLSQAQNGSVRLMAQDEDGQNIHDDITIFIKSDQIGYTYLSQASFLQYPYWIGQAPLRVMMTSLELYIPIEDRIKWRRVMYSTPGPLKQRNQTAEQIIFNYVKSDSLASASYWIMQYSNLTVFLSECRVFHFPGQNLTDGYCFHIGRLEANSSISECAIIMTSLMNVALIFSEETDRVYFYNRTLSLIDSMAIDGCMDLRASYCKANQFFFCFANQTVRAIKVLEGQYYYKYDIDANLLGIPVFNPSSILTTPNFPNLLFVQEPSGVVLFYFGLIPDYFLVPSVINYDNLTSMIVSENYLILINLFGQIIYYDISNFYNPDLHDSFANIKISNASFSSSGSQLFFALSPNGTVNYFNSLLPDISYVYGTLNITTSKILSILELDGGDLVIYEEPGTRFLRSELALFFPTLNYEFNYTNPDAQLLQVVLGIFGMPFTYLQYVIYFTNYSNTSLMEYSKTLPMNTLYYIEEVKRLYDGPVTGVIKVKPELPQDEGNFKKSVPVTSNGYINFTISENILIIDGYRLDSASVEYVLLCFSSEGYQILIVEFDSEVTIKTKLVPIPQSDIYNWVCPEIFGFSNTFVVLCEHIITKTQHYLVQNDTFLLLPLDNIIDFARDSRDLYLFILGTVANVPTLIIFHLTEGKELIALPLPIGAGNRLEALDIAFDQFSKLFVYILDSTGTLYIYSLNWLDQFNILYQFIIKLSTSPAFMFTSQTSIPWVDLEVLRVNTDFTTNDIQTEFLIYQDSGYIQYVKYNSTSNVVPRSYINPYPGYTFVANTFSYKPSESWFSICAVNHFGEYALLFYSLESGKLGQNTIGAFSTLLNLKYTSGEKLFTLNKQANYYILETYDYHSVNIEIENKTGVGALASNYISVEIFGPSGKVVTENIYFSVESKGGVTGLEIVLLVAGSVVVLVLLIVIGRKIFLRIKGKRELASSVAEFSQLSDGSD